MREDELVLCDADLKDEHELAITREPKVLILEQHAILMMARTCVGR